MGVTVGLTGEIVIDGVTLGETGVAVGDGLTGVAVSDGDTGDTVSDGDTGDTVIEGLTGVGDGDTCVDVTDGVTGVNEIVAVGVSDGVAVVEGVGVLINSNPNALDAPPPRIPINGLINYPNITCAANTAYCAFPVLTIA